MVSNSGPQVRPLTKSSVGNRRAYEKIQADKLFAVVPNKTHLFEEQGTLQEVARLAADWFQRHLGSNRVYEPSAAPESPGFAISGNPNFFTVLRDGVQFPPQRKLDESSSNETEEKVVTQFKQILHFVHDSNSKQASF